MALRVRLFCKSFRTQLEMVICSFLTRGISNVSCAILQHVVEERLGVKTESRDFHIGYSGVHPKDSGDGARRVQGQTQVRETLLQEAEPVVAPLGRSWGLNLLQLVDGPVSVKGSNSSEKFTCTLLYTNEALYLSQ
jgi:hypothetical protein